MADELVDQDVSPQVTTTPQLLAETKLKIESAIFLLDHIDERVDELKKGATRYSIGEQGAEKGDGKDKGDSNKFALTRRAVARFRLCM